LTFVTSFIPHSCFPCILFDPFLSVSIKFENSRDFNLQHSRPVMSYDDIQPVATEYIRYKVTYLISSWLGLAWLGLAWLGLAWLGFAWLVLAWLGVSCLVLSCLTFSCLYLLLPYLLLSYLMSCLGLPLHCTSSPIFLFVLFLFNVFTLNFSGIKIGLEKQERKLWKTVIGRDENRESQRT
jgi:hypothetical protein